MQISHVRKWNWTRFQDPSSTELDKVDKINFKEFQLNNLSRQGANY